MQAAAVSTNEHFARFSHTLHSKGVRAALEYLLSLTNYRFVGIFRFENGKAHAVIHFDRENPQLLTIESVPDTATYCCYVRDSRGAFRTADAMVDARLTSHPARDAVRAYCGVPVMDPEGVLLGTLCFYDLVPRDPEQVDVFLMLQVASALAQENHVPAVSGDGAR